MSRSKIDVYREYIFAGDHYYRNGDYRKAIEKWETAKRIEPGAGYPYQQLPKVYRKLAVGNFKEGDYRTAIKWYNKLEALVSEAKRTIREGKALSMILWNIKLGPRDQKQIKIIQSKLS